MEILIVLAIATGLGILFTVALLLAIAKEYPTMSMGEIIDAFSAPTEKRIVETKKEERLDIWV